MPMLRARWIQVVWALLALLFSLNTWAVAAAQRANTMLPGTHQAILLDIQGGIGPATQDFVVRGLKKAAEQNAKLVILRIDTPGGLDKSMRGIIRAILSSPVPVVSYVAPGGARAASAGTYILYASHIAAMAPGTNLGAATPVSIGAPSTPAAPNDSAAKAKDKTSKKASGSPKTAMEKKAINDATAYIRSLAELRHRNVQWAEEAVREAVSLSANAALKIHVIDIVATDIPDLLNQTDGMTVNVLGRDQKLSTKNLTVRQIMPSWRTEFLSVITDPSVAYILLLVGIYGIFFEFSNPGFVIPGVVGVISILLALYAFQLLPINYVGLGLLLFGIAFMVAEAFVPSFGALGIGGLIAFIVGSFLLLEKGAVGYQIAMPIIITVSAITAAFFLFVVDVALRARFYPVVSGREELQGSVGEVIGGEGEKGRYRMRIRGELWQIESSETLRAGDKIEVIGRKGLILTVKKTRR